MTDMITKQLNYTDGSLGLPRGFHPPRELFGNGGCPPSDEIDADPGARLGPRTRLGLRLGGDLRGDNALAPRFEPK